MKSNINRIEKEDTCIFQIKGSIDEDFDGQLLITEQHKKIFIDFNEMSQINSCGIREFIDVINICEDKKIYYVNCPKILIDQINNVRGFITNHSQVLSFYAPYYSEDTDEEHTILFKVSDISDNSKAPEINDKDGNPLAFDGFEEKYFKFLIDQKVFNG